MNVHLRNMTDFVEPTETDISRLLELASRLHVPVYRANSRGELIRYTQETS